jgi:hypothetical protein
MNSPKSESSDVTGGSRPDAGSRLSRILVFLEWCLRREAMRPWNYLVLLMPVVAAGYFSENFIVRNLPQQGPELLRTLLWVSAFFVFVGGVRHASKAVCWEVSRELRDLVRLTGIEPKILLWCTSLCRWWTIGLSILMILPLAILARTLGAISFDQWFSGGCWLLLLAALVAGFAMIASVSSNQVSNPETTAATATFLLMVLYHVAFWGFGAVIGLISWGTNGTIDFTSGSLGRKSIQFVLSLAPIAGLYRGLASPSMFTPLDPTYWLHFVTAGFCIWAASIVIHNRFRVTTRGDDGPSVVAQKNQTIVTPPFMRPRCSDRPFFWKDTFILGEGRWSQSFWTAVSLFSLVFVFSAVAYDFPLATAIVAVCAAPCLLAVRFDALLVAEFREQTWNSLMLLPVDPKVFLLEKLRAAAWERKAVLLPVGVAAAFALFSNATALLMTATVAAIAGVLMIEVSILNQFYSKVGLAQSAIALLMILSIGFLVPAWVYLYAGLSFAITVVTMLVYCGFFYWLINWRLRNWTEG